MALKVEIPITTIADGTASENGVMWGSIQKIHVDIGTLANTADITITDLTTGESILTLTDASADSTDYPRRNIDDDAGASIANLYEKFFVGGTVKVAVAEGGSVKSGTVTVYYGR